MPKTTSSPPASSPRRVWLGIWANLSAVGMAWLGVLWMHHQVPGWWWWACFGSFALCALIWFKTLMVDAVKQPGSRWVAMALLGAYPLMMFGFAYALVPVYTWMCVHWHINGKLRSTPTVAALTARPHPGAQQTFDVRTLINRYGHQNRLEATVLTPLQKGRHSGEHLNLAFRLHNPTNTAQRARVRIAIAPGALAPYMTLPNGTQPIVNVPPQSSVTTHVPVVVAASLPYAPHEVAFGLSVFSLNTQESRTHA